MVSVGGDRGFGEYAIAGATPVQNMVKQIKIIWRH